MSRKTPQYFVKIKAAEQLPLDYDFDSESEIFMRKLEKDPDRVKPQKTKKTYTRTFDFPYYEDQHNERRSHKYDEVDKYFDYVTEASLDSGDADSVLEERYHKYKKDRNKRQSKYEVYNNYKKHKENNNYMKQTSISYDENRVISDKKDFNMYINQRPIILQYESQDDLKEPLKSIPQQKPESKKHKGFKIPVSNSKPARDYEVLMADLKNIPPNISGNQQRDTSLNYSQHEFQEETSITRRIAQSVLRLVYLPVFVLGNNKLLQSSRSIQPSLFVNNTNEVIDSQNLMTVFTANNTDQNNLFEQETKSVIKDMQDLTPNQRASKSKSRLSDDRKKSELKKKLCASPLGTAMTADSYASLIASHGETNSTTKGALPSLIKICKGIKNKKDASKHTALDNDKADNEQHKTPSTVKSGTSSKDPKEDHITKQKNKSERKNYSTNNKSVEDEMNNKKKTAKEDKTLPLNKREDLKSTNEEKNIIINIRENPVMSNVLTTASQMKEKEINLNSRGTEGQSLNNTKPSLVSKNYHIVSQGSMITGNYKKVGQNKNDIISLRSFAVPEGERSFVMGPTSNTINSNFDLKENNFIKKTDSANIYNPKEKGTIKSHLTQDDNEIVFESHGNSFTREISLNELKGISNMNVQNGEEKRILNNSTVILKKEDLNNMKGVNGQEINQNNKNYQGKNTGRPQLNVTNSTQEVDGLGMVPQPSLEVFYEEDDKIINSNSQIQPNVNDQSVHKPQRKKSSLVSLVGKPLEIIHPPPVSSSVIQSTNNILFLKSGEPGEPLNDHPPKLFDFTETFLIVFFQTAQYISGVSCYDKLIDIIDFFYCEDD